MRTLRKMILAAVFAAAAFVVIQPADAQVQNKISKPGYLIFRVLLGGGAPQANPNNPNAPPAAAPQGGDPTHSVAAVVPYTSIEKRLIHLDRTPSRDTNPVAVGVKHKYGWVFPAEDKTQIQFFFVPNISHERNLKDAYETWSKKRTYDGIHDIINTALMLGLVNDAFHYCEEYLKMPELMDKLPKTSRFDDFSKAFKDMPEKLLSTPDKKDAKLPANPQAAEWKSRVSGAGIAESKFYSVVYFDSNQAADAQRKANLLDQNLRAFFLWHALQGVALPVPQKKLLALISDSTNRVTDYRDALDGRPIVSDAFYSPSHNILMLAPERMDQQGNAFMNLVRAKYGAGWNREELIANKMTISPGKAPDAMRMQMLAVADKYITDEAENAAISREGCRQLMASTGMLPQNVRLPQWLENGVGLYYQRAKGPLYIVKNGAVKMVVGLATGYGTPNFEQHRAFDQVRPIMSRKPDASLRNVLMNAYYAGAAAGTDIDPRLRTETEGNTTTIFEVTERVHPQDNSPQARAFRTRLKEKADSSAWALVYYLEKTRLVGLQNFFNDLAKQPRDMKLEEEEVVRLFCKNFGLVRVDQSVDPAAFLNFASNWLQYMANVPHYDYEQPLDAATLDPFAGGGAGPNGAGPGGGGPGGGGPGGGGPGGGGTPPPPGGGGTPPGRPARPGG